MAQHLGSQLVLKRTQAQFLAPTRQPSVTPASSVLMPFSGLDGHQAHIWYTDIHVGKTHEIKIK